MLSSYFVLDYPLHYHIAISCLQVHYIQWIDLASKHYIELGYNNSMGYLIQEGETLDFPFPPGMPHVQPWGIPVSYNNIACVNTQLQHWK